MATHRTFFLPCLLGIVVACSSVWAEGTKIHPVYTEFKHIDMRLQPRNLPGGKVKVAPQFSLAYPVVSGPSARRNAQINQEIHQQILSFLEIQEVNPELSPQEFAKKLSLTLKEIPDFMTIILSSMISSPGSRLLSCQLEAYAYREGAAHGYGGRKYIHFDLTQGEKIALKDLFSKETFSDFIAFLDKKLSEKLGDTYTHPNFAKMDWETVSLFEKAGDCVILFPQYSVAPGSEGHVELSIPFEDLKDFINKSHFFWDAYGFTRDKTFY